MPLKIVRNDITKMKTEAIVNTANEHPAVGTGCDHAVYEAAGYDDLLSYRKKNIGTVKEGDVFLTPGFRLPSKYIIHAVSPLYVDGKSNEEELLRSCYRKSLALAAQRGIRSIAFPLISTGGFGYPKEEGMRIAVDEINAFLLANEMLVYLVVFDEKATRMGKNLYPDLEAYIDRNYVREKRIEEYSAAYRPAPKGGGGNARTGGLLRRGRALRELLNRDKEKGKPFRESQKERESLLNAERCPAPEAISEDKRDHIRRERTSEEERDHIRRERTSEEERDHIRREQAFEKERKEIRPERTSEEEREDFLPEWFSADEEMSASPIQAPSPFSSSYSQARIDEEDAQIEEMRRKLMERIRHMSDTFPQYLLYLIREKGMDNSEVYKRAIVDKKVFSKIKNNQDYHPQKLTALCLCIGAKLNLDESRDLLSRAGYALSPCDKTDIIFSYFIENEIYDMIELDIQLEEHGLPCIIK